MSNNNEDHDFSVAAHTFGAGLSKSITDLLEIKGETFVKVDAVTDQEITSRQAPEPGTTETVTPPYAPLTYLTLLEQNTRLARCVDITTVNTVGLGWEIVNVDDADIGQDVERNNLQNVQSKIVKSFFSTCAGILPFTEVMKKVKKDELATGNGYLEVARNVAGKPARVYHLPSQTVLALRRGGYLQTQGSTKRYFKAYGDTRVISARTGREDDTIPFSERATEVLHFRNYASRTEYYGIPKFVGALPAISGTRLAATRNLVFFQNDAVPRMVITVSGGQLTGPSVQMIENFFKTEAKGVSKAHRVLVLQAEPRQVALTKENPTRISVEPLTVGVRDDASFEAYREANNDEVREAFGLSPVFFGSETGGKGATLEAKRTTIEQEFIPDIEVKEHILNNTIVRDLLSETTTLSDAVEQKLNNDKLYTIMKGGIRETYKETLLLKMGYERTFLFDKESSKETLVTLPLVRIKFNRPDFVDYVAEAEKERKLQSVGVVKINESRKVLGLKPMPHEWAELPFPIAQALISSGTKPNAPTQEPATAGTPTTPTEGDGAIAGFSLNAVLENLLTIRKTILGNLGE